MTMPAPPFFEVACMHKPRRSRWLPILPLCVWMATAPAQLAIADEVRLKNGLILNGAAAEIEALTTPSNKKSDPESIRITPILCVKTPLQKYFVNANRRDSAKSGGELGKHETFKLKQQRLAGAGVRMLQQVGDPIEKPPPFDRFGRRTVKFEGGQTIIQGVEQITPEYVKIIGLNVTWETAVATSSIPPEEIDAMLRQLIDVKNPDHRLVVLRFYIDAQMYAMAAREINSIGNDFPELGDKLSEAKVLLAQAFARELLGELKLRQTAGQHHFVAAACRNFPTENVEPEVLRELRDLAAGYETAAEKGDQVRTLLGELQAKLGADARVKDVDPLRAEIAESLGDSNLARLDAFLNLAGDPQLAPAEKLALALSGWVVGGADAVTELDQALRLWQARGLVLDYLRTPDDGATQRKSILEKLSSLEGVGPAAISRMIPLLPPPLDSAGAAAGQPVRIQVTPDSDDVPIAYSVVLPQEYHPDHFYPLIIALHGENGSAAQELAFWAGTPEKPGQSQRRGYIVIAPEFATRSKQEHYDYSPVAHAIVMGALRDARKRFSVDSDRVFLSGHRMGADAAFDIGMSHPDLFAGVMPISGVSDRYCHFYRDNARPLPFYVVIGELDRDTFARNVSDMEWMLKHNLDLIYTVYIGAGAGSFYSEIHKLFDWMALQRRVRRPRLVKGETLRTTDNRFYWYEFEGLPEGIVNVEWTAKKSRPIKPMNVIAEVKPNNTIVITARPTRHRIWLTPEDNLIDFSKRLQVRINSIVKWNAFVEPDVGAMLEHARLQGDRQQLYWAVLEF